jgi:hypothetical protein
MRTSDNPTRRVENARCHDVDVEDERLSPAPPLPAIGQPWGEWDARGFGPIDGVEDLVGPLHHVKGIEAEGGLWDACRALRDYTALDDARSDAIISVPLAWRLLLTKQSMRLTSGVDASLWPATLCHFAFGHAVPWSAASGWLPAGQTGLTDRARTGACQTPEADCTKE